jgi:hypothetical protein
MSADNYRKLVEVLVNFDNGAISMVGLVDQITGLLRVRC